MKNKIECFITISLLIFVLGIVGLAFSFNIWMGILTIGFAGIWIGSLILIALKRMNKKREL